MSTAPAFAAARAPGAVLPHSPGPLPGFAGGFHGGHHGPRPGPHHRGPLGYPGFTTSFIGDLPYAGAPAEPLDPQAGEPAAPPPLAPFGPEARRCVPPQIIEINGGIGGRRLPKVNYLAPFCGR